MSLSLFLPCFLYFQSGQSLHSSLHVLLFILLTICLFTCTIAPVCYIGLASDLVKTSLSAVFDSTGQCFSKFLFDWMNVFKLEKMLGLTTETWLALLGLDKG